MLSGLLACGACGANMILTSGKRGGYYGCYAAHRIGTCGNKRHVQLRKLENAIVGAVAEILDTPEMATEIANKCNAKLRKRLAEDPNSIERLRGEREKLERQIERLVTFIAEEGGSTAVKAKLQENEARLATLRVQIMQLEAVKRDPVLVTPHAVQERLRGLVGLLRGVPTRARKVLEQVLDGKVAVNATEGDNVHAKGLLCVRDGQVISEQGFCRPVV